MIQAFTESSIDVNVLPVASIPTKKPKRRGKNLTDSAKEILSIRNQLGISQPDFAVALGETRDKIINIENGRLLRIPQDLLERAREIVSAEATYRVQPLKELEKFTMPQLVDRWKQMVCAKDYKEVAILLGTTFTTVERWRHGGVRPESNNILRYELMAKREQSRIAEKKPTYPSVSDSAAL